LHLFPVQQRQQQHRCPAATCNVEQLQLQRLCRINASYTRFYGFAAKQKRQRLEKCERSLLPLPVAGGWWLFLVLVRLQLFPEI